MRGRRPISCFLRYRFTIAIFLRLPGWDASPSQSPPTLGLNRLYLKRDLKEIPGLSFQQFISEGIFYFPVSNAFQLCESKCLGLDQEVHFVCHLRYVLVHNLFSTR